MGQYLKLFDTHINYQNFVNSGQMLKPNVSHCFTENEVHYNPLVQGISKINGFNVPFVTSSSTSFFTNPFTITMVIPVNVNSATVNIYGWRFDEELNDTVPEPGELRETTTATSENGIDWISTLNSSYNYSNVVITITFNINNKNMTYQTYYKFDGK